jgi:hypothetical protein
MVSAVYVTGNYIELNWSMWFAMVIPLVEVMSVSGIIFRNHVPPDWSTPTRDATANLGVVDGRWTDVLIKTVFITEN